MSPPDIGAQYRAYCTELGIKANSRVLKELPATSVEAAHFTSWDLSGNVVGTKGAIAIAKTVQTCLPQLQRLSLSGNNLASNVTQDLYNAFVSHPSLTALDVSNNDIRLGGPALVDLVKKNKKIVELRIEGTYLRPLFERLIALHLKRNNDSVHGPAAPTTSAAAAPVAAPPQQHPPAVPSVATSGLVAFHVGGEGSTSARHPGGQSTTSMGDAGTSMSTNPKKKRMKFAGDALDKEDHDHSEDPSSPFGGHAAPAADGADPFGAFGEASPFDIKPLGVAAGGAGAKKVRRPTVSSEIYQDSEIDNFQPNKNEHDPDIRRFLFETLESHELFSHLEDHELYVAVDAMDGVNRGKGEVLFEIGDEDIDTFFVVVEGTVAIKNGSGTTTKVSTGGTLLDTMLLYGGKAAETAQAETDVLLYTLDRRTYRCVLSQASKKKRTMYEGFLTGISFLKHLSKPEILALADALKPAHYEKGQKLITYGSHGENFFLIVEGKVDVFGRDDNGQPKWVCEFKEGDCVGELEFLHNHLCVADVVAQTDVLRTARMNRRHFEMVMGPVKDVLARTAQENEKFSYYRDQLSKMQHQTDGSPSKPASPTPVQK